MPYDSRDIKELRKEYIRQGAIPDTAQIYYPNGDMTPHVGPGNADSDKLHITVWFLYTRVGIEYKRVLHVYVEEDDDGYEYQSHELFPEREVAET